MNSHSGGHSRMCRCLAICLATIAISAAGTVRFIPATPENTRLADGSPLPEKLESIGWKLRADVGNGGVFESNPDVLAETLMVEVTGLEPGKAYEVFGFFWADGFGLDHPETRGQRPAQFGTSLATLHTFDGPDGPVRGHVCAWQVTPGGTAGAAYGLKSAIEEEQPLEGLRKLQLRHDDARLVRARLGRLRADTDGKLPVFFADYPYHRPSGPAWIDGVAVRPLDVEGPLEQGWKNDTWLHLALRAGDPITIERELRRGADVNALDEEHLSPLFHAVTSTDVSLVKRLLDMGADPNRATQSATPLCVAVVLSCEEIVKLLLDAGAQVPPALAADSGTLTLTLHPGHLHPVVRAFQAGSIPILEMLLAQQPNLDVRKLMDMKSIKLDKRIELRVPETKALYEAIESENWNFSNYLIDKGYADIGGYKPDSRLLATCVAAGEPAMPVFERLLKLGIPPVDFKSLGTSSRDKNGNGRRHDGSSGWMRPVDALSAAVWAGNVPLVQRFLPQARYAPLDYLELLYMTAAHAQNQTLLDMLKSEFRSIRPLRWQPDPQSDPRETMRDEDLRIFLPRTTAPPARPDRQAGEYVLGVIGSPGAEDVGVALTAAASTTKGLKAVDRELIETALQESDSEKPWLKGEHLLAPLGDRLSADALVVVDVIKGGKESLYSFEVVEVATGMVVHREHLPASGPDMQKDLAALLERSTRALDAAGRNSRRQAVTLLSFTSRGDLPNELALAKVLHATIQHQVDSTPGLISLTRAQSARLVEEQVLQGKNSIWGAAHLVEGSVSPADKPGMIKVALRLETLGADRSSVKTDAEATGDIQDSQHVITTAWQNLFAKTQGVRGDKEVVTRDDTSSKPFAEEEAKRLLQEAQWLMASRIYPEKIESLIESAGALGGPLDEIIHGHLDYMFQRIESLSLKYLGRPDTVEGLYTGPKGLSYLPVALDLSDRMTHELPLARALLHQAGYYFDFRIQNRQAVNRRDNAFCLVINALSYMRAAIYPDFVPESLSNDFIMFGEELDAFTKRYYDLLALEKTTDIGRSMPYSGGHRWLFKRNPEFYRGIVQTTRRINRINQIFPHGLDKHHGGTQLARDILGTLDDDTSPKAELFKADIRCYLASAEEAPLLTRRFIAAAMNYNRVDWYKLDISDRAATSMVSRHTPDSWFDWTENGGGTLPTLVHSPRPSPEAIRKPGCYLNTNFYRSGLPRPMEDRWFQIGSSDDWYDKKMQAAMTRKDAVRLRNLLDALPLHHMYSGHEHQSLLGKRYGGVLKQLTAPEVPGTGVTGTLTADFRSATTANPGSARWFLRDQENPDLLWIFYFSSIEQSLGVDSSGKAVWYSEKPQTAFRNIWLLGYNCRTEKMEMKVNLHQSALQAIGCNEPAGAMGAWDMALDQNKSAIMTNVKVSHGRENRSHSHGTRIIVIDKATGTVRCLPEGHEIADFTQRKTHACWVNVAGLDDDFYFIDESGYRASVNRNAKSGDKKTVSIYRVDADLKVSPLVEHGRRPALTPFDAPDTIPTELAVDDKRLLVYNGKLHASFNPKENSWETVGNHHTRYGYLMYHFAQRELHRHMDPVHNIHVEGADTGWKIDFQKPKPGKLWCLHDKLGAMDLNVKLEIPQDFRDNTTFVVNEPGPEEPGSSSRKSIFKEKSFDEYTKDHPPRVVVLNQTDDNLILGMQAGAAFRWTRPSREGVHLPFLWKVSKKEVLALLEGGTAKQLSK